MSLIVLKDTLEEVYDHILEITVDNTRTRALLSGQEGEIETLPSPMEAFVNSIRS